MTGLPAPLIDPLQVLPVQLLFWLGVLLMSSLMILAARRLLGRTGVASQSDSISVASPPVIDDRPLVARVRDLRDRIVQSGAFRDGCHQLAAEVRSHLERVTAFEAEEMTSSEIAKASSDGRVGRYMRELRGYQFSRREPREPEFLRACDRAETLFG